MEINGIVGQFGNFIATAWVPSSIALDGQGIHAVVAGKWRCHLWFSHRIMMLLLLRKILVAE